MECNIVKDLLPLYIDDCCSAESAKAVAEHLCSCERCRAVHEAMLADPGAAPALPVPNAFGKIRDFKASILQSVSLLASFAMISAGVTLEAATSSGYFNGYWAIILVVPATGFLLSLVNWYFVRQYKSRKHFSTGSLLTTLVITVCAFLWAVFHYDVFTRAGNPVLLLVSFYWPGLLLTAMLCVLSKLLSSRYAAMIGKE